jgi:hypothetical protein
MDVAMSPYQLQHGRALFAALRADGFAFDSDSSAGGGRTVLWVKTVGKRKLEVQLWGGQEKLPHRVSHFLDGRMSTRPTYFCTAEGLHLAVQLELARCDHKPHPEKIGCVQHDCAKCHAQTERAKAFREEVEKSCGGCEFDEAEGGLFSHCAKCCHRIATAAWAFAHEAQR